MFNNKQVELPRFVEVYHQNKPAFCRILVDTKTGVNYFYHQEGGAGGLTVLLAPDGSPVITPLELLFPQNYQ